jgi:hypothetical protein
LEHGKSSSFGQLFVIKGQQVSFSFLNLVQHLLAEVFDSDVLLDFHIIALLLTELLSLNQFLL